MHIGARRPGRTADTAPSVRPSSKRSERPRGSAGPVGPPDMHLVAVERRTVAQRACRVTASSRFSPVSTVSTSSSPSPAHRPRRALDARPGRRRCARASGSRRTAPARGRRAAHAPAMSMSQPSSRSTAQIGDRRLRARQHAPARSRPASASPRAHQHELDVRLGPQRVEVVEIGDPRQQRHRDTHRARRPAARPQVGRVLGRQPARRRRNAAPGRAPASRSARRSSRMPVGEQARIAAHAVDDEAARPARRPPGRARRGCRPGSRSPRRGRCRRRSRPACRPPARTPYWRCRRAQVDLGGAARALHQHEVGLGAQPARSSPARTAAGAASAPGIRGPRAVANTRPCTTTCAPVSLCGLSSTGFMCDARRHAGGARLQRLRAPDLAAVRPPTAALFDMFCGLNGSTRRPRRRQARASPATSTDLPTLDPGALQHDGARGRIRTRSPPAPSRRPRSDALPASSR